MWRILAALLALSLIPCWLWLERGLLAVPDDFQQRVVMQSQISADGNVLQRERISLHLQAADAHDAIDRVASHLTIAGITGQAPISRQTILDVNPVDWTLRRDNDAQNPVHLFGPRNASREGFRFRDPLTGEYVAMEFIDVSRTAGVATPGEVIRYRFAGELEDEQLQRSVFRPGAAPLSRARITLELEPISGHWLNYRATFTRRGAAEQGGPDSAATLNQETVAMAPASIERQLQAAERQRHRVMVAQVIGPWLVVIAMVLLFAYAARPLWTLPATLMVVASIGVAGLVAALLSLDSTNVLYGYVLPQSWLTALLFPLLAAALWALARQREKVSRGLASTLLVAGALSALGALSGGSTAALASSATVALMALGQLMVPFRRCGHWRALIMVIPAVQFAIGLAVVAAFFAAAYGKYFWPPVLVPASLTGAALLLSGVAGLAVFSRQLGRWSHPVALRLVPGLLSFVTASVLSAALALAWRAQEYRAIQILLNESLTELNDLVTERINDGAQATARLAARVVALDPDNVAAAWRADAERYLSDMPSLHSLHWYRADGVIRARVPPASDQATDPIAVLDQALAQSPAQISRVFSRALTLADGSRGVAVFHRADNGSAGNYHVGVFNLDAVFSQAYDDLDLAPDMQLDVNRGLALALPGTQAVQAEWARAAAELAWLPNNWRTQARATAALTQGRTTALPSVVAGSGVVFGFTLALLATLVQARNSQNRQLQTELRVRRRLEQRLNTLIAHSPHGILLVDKDGTVKMANTMAEQIFHFPTGTLRNQNLEVLLPAASRERHRHYMRTFMAENTPRIMGAGMDVFGQRHDGETFPAQVGLVPVDVDGEPHVLASIVDISEQKQRETRLLRSQQALVNLVADVREQKAQAENISQFVELVLENIPHLVFVKDAKDLRFVRINRAMEKLIGRPRSELLGKSVADLLPAGRAEQFDADDRKVLKEKIMLDLPRERVMHRTLGERVLHTKKLPILDRDGNAVYLLGISEDITQQLAERQQVELQSYMLSMSNDAIIVSDDNGIVFWNRGAERLYGYSKDEAEGKTTEELIQPQYPEPRAAIQAVLKQHEQWQGRVRHTCKDGSYLMVESVCQNVTDHEGRRFVLEINRDISQTLSYEHTLETKTRELERSNKELEQFAYLASHDLQEPLRKLVSFSQYLEEDLGDELNERAQTDLFYVTDSASRMRSLVQDLLELSRAGTGHLNIVDLDMNEVVEDALRACAATIEAAGAEIRRDCLPHVQGDRRYLTQLYQNLITNALKFVARGKKPIIHLTVEQRGEQTIFGVKDNGIGIKPEYRDKIFQPFQRLHGRDEYTGSGIGLSICRRAVERHHGELWVEGGPGEGSHFRFTLGEPYDRDDELDAPAA